MKEWLIHEDIKQAWTLPSRFYLDESCFEKTIEKVFRRSWHWLIESSKTNTHNLIPGTLLDQVLDEPVLVSKDQDGKTHVLSNVCTHRGKILVEECSSKRTINCGYHGRCFHLNGTFKSMPCFEGVSNFPSPGDDLVSIPFHMALGQLWLSLDPQVDLSEMIRPMMERTGFLNWQALSPEPSHIKDYYLDSNWALYVDNYLEGFHIPFVHPGLNSSLSMDQYDIELFDHMSLQLGVAKSGEETFEIPEGHPDSGKGVFAYYWWMFPNVMFNIYPWGLSLNVVEPLSHNRTRIRFRAYSFMNVNIEREGYGLDETEMEDEAVVLSVQKGLHSKFYDRGRYSPNMELGVHHFHRLLTKSIFG